MSEQEEFEAKFEQLTAIQVRVLEQFVLGRSDEEIAANHRIKKSTVRKHIQYICDTLDVEKKGSRYRRNSLVMLIAKYKPELINGETPPSSTIEPELQQTSTFDPEFVGRGDAMRDLDNLFNRGTKCILILSPGGRGKTTLAWRYLQSRFSPDEILYFPIAKETKDIASVESLVEERLRKLGEEPGREFMVSLERLREKLTEKPMGVLIDNLEPALDESNRFIPQHRSYLDLFAQVLLSPQVQAVTIITSRAPLHEGLDITPYPLEPLDVAAWQAYFEHESIVTNAPVLEEMHETYNGNALAMKVLCHPICHYYEGDLAAYWADSKTADGLLVEEQIKNLIEEQFNTLERLHPNAYKLLCRMGCYRYQDVPTVPKEGLFCFLWDVPKLEHQRTVRALKDRALVDFFKGEYRLHPAIRADALKRLRESIDCEQANLVAAEFWRKSVKIVRTVKDAIQALEANFHYLEINHFEQGCDVIIQERKNGITSESGKEYIVTLGTSCYLFGLYYKVTSEILTLIEKVINKNKKSRLYNILGHIFSSQGRVREAIDCNFKSGELARQKNHKKYEIFALMDLGLRFIDLNEIEESRSYFLQALNFAKKEKFKNRILFIETHLCLIDSIQLYTDTKVDFYSKNKDFFPEMSLWNKAWCFCILGIAYKNFGQNTKSSMLLNQSKELAQEYQYPQISGKSLTQLSELCRIENDFLKALSLHKESIKILERIGAKCDLAEACYQLALTHQKMRNSESETHFKKAIQLWTEIDAPKQIDRVRNSIERAIEQ